MRNAPFFSSGGFSVTLFTAGCAGPEQKLVAAWETLVEIVRMGELRRSVEQTAVLDSPGAGYTAGLVRGIDLRWRARAMGL